MTSSKSENYFIVLILIIISSLIIRIFLLHPTFSDESFYFNVGKQILNGYIPYKDFFFAHPPLQVYILAFLFKAFGTSFLVGKLLSLITSTLSAFLVYLILKKLYDEKSGFLAALVFLITPVFLSFSTIGYGMWETVLFILLSIYLVMKNKLNFAGISFLIAILFRYIAILYLPFLIVLLYFRKQKLKIFSVWFFSLFFVLIILLLFIFGFQYIEQTIAYQIFSKTSVDTFGVQMQYWSIGYFFIFLALISIVTAYINKDKILLLFSLYPLIIDFIILFGLKLFFYHYFLISLVLYIMAIGRTLIISKERIVQIIIPFILFLSIITNFQTIDFYLNSTYAEKYYFMASFIENKTSVNDSIFGEPIATNYISFITKRKISSSYFDSYLEHLIFEGEQEVIETLEKDKPRFFIEMDTYYYSDQYLRKFIIDNYILEKRIEGIPVYSIYRVNK
jgi:4-amino-4-deoxy-L-arabinose transferase-like glycosyltransferase